MRSLVRAAAAVADSASAGPRSAPARGLVALLLATGACTSASSDGPTDLSPRGGAASRPASRPSAAPEGTVEAPAPEPGLEVATFAGGCFWCMEPPFEAMSGVKAVLSGYTGGEEPSPAYRQVASGRTGHAEAVRVYFDPDFVTYNELLDVFWRNIDPTDAGGQFVDRGRQYRTGIFVHDEAQRAAAEASKAALAESGRFDAPLVTPIEDAGRFWVAEEYHQDFYQKKPSHYRRYKRGSGRVRFIEEHWGSSEP